LLRREGTNPETAGEIFLKKGKKPENSHGGINQGGKEKPPCAKGNGKKTFLLLAAQPLQTIP